MKGAKNLGTLSPGGVYPKVICSQCGKEFTMPCECRVYPFKILKYGKYKDYFCSWSCMRERERQTPRKERIYYDYLT